MIYLPAIAIFYDSNSDAHEMVMLRTEDAQYCRIFFVKKRIIHTMVVMSDCLSLQMGPKVIYSQLMHFLFLETAQNLLYNDLMLLKCIHIFNTDCKAFNLQTWTVLWKRKTFFTSLLKYNYP